MQWTVYSQLDLVSLPLDQGKVQSRAVFLPQPFFIPSDWFFRPFRQPKLERQPVPSVSFPFITNSSDVCYSSINLDDFGVAASRRQSPSHYTCSILVTHLSTIAACESLLNH